MLASPIRMTAVTRRCRWLLVVAALSCLPSSVVAQVDDQERPLDECEVIARINSEVILACELDWQVRLMFEERFGPQAATMIDSPMLAQARRELLKQLVIGRIDIGLLYADFRSNAPGADMASIRKQLQEPFEESELPRLMKSVGVEDQADLEKRLLQLGTSLTERREDFIRTMIAQTWIRQSITFDREVTHDQMLDYYHEHEAEYDQPERVKWEELMVRFDNHRSKREAWAAMAKLGNEAHTLTQGAAADKPAFSKLAKAKSDGFTADEGGQHGWTIRGSLASTAVDQALFTLPAGQMSPILEGPMGFHIVRVIEHKEAGPTPFSEVQAAIRRGLQDERSKAAIDEKINELRESARIWTVFTGDMSYEELAALQEGPTRR